MEKKETKKKTFAVVKIGGAQEIVNEGDVLEISRVEGKEGSKFKVRDVLLVAAPDKVKIGTPFVGEAEVTFKILEHTKEKKIEVRKFRAKSRYRRKAGHRQPISKVQVEKIAV